MACVTVQMDTTGGHRDGVRRPDDREAREVGDRSLASGFALCESWEGPCISPERSGLDGILERVLFAPTDWRGWHGSDQPTKETGGGSGAQDCGSDQAPAGLCKPQGF